MFELISNVTVTHGGSTHHLKAGIHDALPTGVGELLLKSKLAKRVVVIVEDGEQDLADMTVQQLKEIAKGLGIQGYSNLRREDLLVAIEAAQAQEGGE